MTDESHFLLACSTDSKSAAHATTDCPLRGLLAKVGEWLEAMGECPPVHPFHLLTYGELMGPDLYRAASGFGAKGGES